MRINGFEVRVMCKPNTAPEKIYLTVEGCIKDNPDATEIIYGFQLADLNKKRMLKEWFNTVEEAVKYASDY